MKNLVIEVSEKTYNIILYALRHEMAVALNEDKGYKFDCAKNAIEDITHKSKEFKGETNYEKS